MIPDVLFAVCPRAAAHRRTGAWGCLRSESPRAAGRTRVAELRSQSINAGGPYDVPYAVADTSVRVMPYPRRRPGTRRPIGLVSYTLGSAAAARRSIMWSTSVPPSHIEASATQAVNARVEAPETPAPIEHPPASMAPNPISTAPSR